MTLETAGSLSVEDFEQEFAELLYRAVNDQEGGARMERAIARAMASDFFARWSLDGLARPDIQGVRALAVAFAFGLFAAAQEGEMRQKGGRTL